MDAERYQGSPVGALRPIVFRDPRDEVEYRHVAFLPAALPRNVELGSETLGTLLDAQLALGRLDGAASELPDPLLLVRPVIRQEAVSTSALEGTITVLDEVLRGEVTGAEGEPDVREVLNYVQAAEHGLARLRDRPIGLTLLNEVHDILIRGTRGDSVERGRVRTRQNWIGPQGRPITEAEFVPPPPGDDLTAGLDDWERYLHEERVPLLVRCALGHYQFETLHPYHDGNGRLGRLVTVLQLIETEVLRHHLLSLSPYLERRRDEYVGHLTRVRQTGEWDPWVRFFAGALGAEAERSLDRIVRLRGWRGEMVDRVRSSGTRGLTVQITQDLIGYPFLSVPDTADRYGKTYQAASDAVRKLVDLGVLTEVAGASNPRVYAAREVPRIVTGPG